MKKWIAMFAVTIALVVLGLTLPAAMSSTCHGTCFGDPVTCECSGGCVIDCSQPAPFCSCTCN